MDGDVWSAEVLHHLEGRLCEGKLAVSSIVVTYYSTVLRPRLQTCHPAAQRLDDQTIVSRVAGCAARHVNVLRASLVWHRGAAPLFPPGRACRALGLDRRDWRCFGNFTQGSRSKLGRTGFFDSCDQRAPKRYFEIRAARFGCIIPAPSSDILHCEKSRTLHLPPFWGYRQDDGNLILRTSLAPATPHSRLLPRSAESFIDVLAVLSTTTSSPTRVQRKERMLTGIVRVLLLRACFCFDHLPVTSSRFCTC